MTLRDYLRVLRERWAIVLCAVLVGLSTASAIVMLRPPDYTAKITMYVSSQATLDPTSAYQGAQLSQERVKSYVELVTSTRVSRVVAAELGLRESPEDVAEKITA
ncbi:MAG: Wzz/FepE/Etk N-terminal domain-containing protein, partial [Actinomycetota bacterium]|nr:Wzz/FepE/Etk N-terminal domain-containing protein [Actinomycetota bacterium]MDQ4118320.1 Wzz/FepE/Etk N-terminal domain-containing protein [Actinomycetota bacterium]